MEQTIYLDSKEIADAIDLYLATKGLFAEEIVWKNKGRKIRMACKNVSNREPRAIVKKSELEKLQKKLNTYEENEQANKL